MSCNITFHVRSSALHIPVNLILCVPLVISLFLSHLFLLPHTGQAASAAGSISGIVILTLTVVLIVYVVCVIAIIGLLLGRYRFKQHRNQHSARIQVCICICNGYMKNAAFLEVMTQLMLMHDAHIWVKCIYVANCDCFDISNIYHHYSCHSPTLCTESAQVSYMDNLCIMRWVIGNHSNKLIVVHSHRLVQENIQLSRGLNNVITT